MVIRKKAIENEVMIKKISHFLDSINISYNNISHYILAFIHRSVVNEKPDYAPEHNERLEFLGDAVLELVITSNLYNEFPKKPEGELTDIRSSIVRGKNLAKVGRKLDIGKYLLLGKGEDKGGGRDNDYLLANTIEAIIGAIYIDLGFEVAELFINTYIYVTLTEILEKKLLKDFKTTIQEKIQAERDITPTYKVLGDEGKDHEKTFTVGIFFLDELIAEGKGSSKKKAEEAAAEAAYYKLTDEK